MKKCGTAKFLLGCAAPVVVVALSGCGSGSHPPSGPISPGVAPTSSSKPPQPAATSSTAVRAGNNACANAQFSSQQFAGDWTEEGDTKVTTLSVDGALKASGGNDNESGTWSYEPWALTPGKSKMPPGEETTVPSGCIGRYPDLRWIWFTYHSKSTAHRFNSAMSAAATPSRGWARNLRLNSLR